MLCPQAYLNNSTIEPYNISPTQGKAKLSRVSPSWEKKFSKQNDVFWMLWLIKQLLMRKQSKQCLTVIRDWQSSNNSHQHNSKDSKCTAHACSPKNIIGSSNTCMYMIIDCTACTLVFNSLYIYGLPQDTSASNFISMTRRHANTSFVIFIQST